MGGQSWQKIGDKPYQLFHGIGFASYFYDFTDGTLLEKIGRLKMTQLISCVVSLIIAFGVFLKYREKINPKFFALVALKFYLIFFYAFIQVPYAYLLYIPIFLTIYLVSYFPFRFNLDA